MEWWGWLVAYASVGAVCIPIDATISYREEARDTDKIRNHPEDEIVRLKKAASSNLSWSLLCIPLWPIFIMMVTGKGFGVLGTLIARKDVKKLEDQIAFKKAEAIAEQYRKDHDNDLNKQFEGLT